MGRWWKLKPQGNCNWLRTLRNFLNRTDWALVLSSSGWRMKGAPHQVSLKTDNEMRSLKYCSHRCIEVLYYSLLSTMDRVSCSHLAIETVLLGRKRQG